MRSLTSRRLGRVCGALLAAATALALGVGVAEAKPSKYGEHCTTPDGLDLNEHYGVSVTVVAPFCRPLRAGEQWTVTAAWFVAETFEAVPPEFVPAGPTPLEDFRAKFVGAEFVIDAGTPQEQTILLENSSRLYTAAVDGFVEINTITLGTLRPLSKGTHTYELYWRFSAMHCDGIAAVVEENCFPAGDTLYRAVSFEVVHA